MTAAPSHAEAPPRRLRRIRLRIRWIERGLAAAIILAGALAAALPGPRLGPLGAMAIDAFQRADPRPYDPTLPVRIVAIDAESLQRFGQWPWPRTYIAELIRRLRRLGAAAIAFDILFAEPDRTSPELITESARRFDPDAPRFVPLVDHTQHDALLARAMADAPVALAALPGAGDGEEAPLERKYGMVVAGGDPRPRLGRAGAVNEPLRILIGNASGYGLGGVSVGEGSVVRRAPLFSVVGGEIAPALSMEALRVAQQARGYVLRSSDTGEAGGGGAAPVVVDARNGGVVVPLSSDGGVWIRYAGHREERFLAAWRVLEGDAPDPALEDPLLGHIVIVAATAPGLGQPVATPLDAGVQAAEIHAEVLEQALSGVTLQRPDWAPGAEALAVVVIGLATAALTTWLSPLAGLLVGALLPGAALAGSWLAFERAGLLLSPVTPILTGLILYTALTALNYLRSRRESGAVRSQFERFVAPAVISELVSDPDAHLAMTGSGRELTVLFSDARGFTRMSETMSPDALIGYLNACFGELTEAVLAEGGTVDKYMGDCIMAFWNAPLDVPDHADRALRAAFAIREAQDRLNALFAGDGRPQVDFGVGMNSGPCNVGLMGSPRRLEYSCVGDTVNVASRLQDLTKLYGTWNVVGEATLKAATPGWIAAPLDRARLRNRTEAVPVWTVLGPVGTTLPAPLARYRDAAAAARDAIDSGRDATEALAELRAVSAPGIAGAKLADALAARIRETEAA